MSSFSLFLGLLFVQCCDAWLKMLSYGEFGLMIGKKKA
ncbi:hypothetical protein VVMO6_03046 [Vibrio vulnificus MO6-24/O]|nr:hypothetical protein VVMO6_03046 [Vibrio vulnificus MO6-24/O]